MKRRTHSFFGYSSSLITRSPQTSLRPVDRRLCSRVSTRRHSLCQKRGKRDGKEGNVYNDVTPLKSMNYGFPFIVPDRVVWYSFRSKRDTQSKGHVRCRHSFFPLLCIVSSTRSPRSDLTRGLNTH